MYRCQTCRARTEDIDNVPCKTKDHTFLPQEIATLHRFVRTPDNGWIVLCTGKGPGSARGIGSDLGVTCIRCRQKMLESREQT